LGDVALKYLTQYKIQFSGLKEGTHQFDFRVDDRFFDEFEDSEIEKGLIDVIVRLEKRSTHLVLNFELKGEVQLVCDRCLDDYIQPMECESVLYVKFSEGPQEGAADIIYIHPNDCQVEIGHLIYELIILNLPIKHAHPENEEGESDCNPEMLQKLKDINAPGNTDTEGDSRWNDLKKIIDN
jgi:uncharacterized metal-binding protein YceD (DUF177 family)